LPPPGGVGTEFRKGPATWPAPFVVAEVSSPAWPEMLLRRDFEMYMIGWDGLRRVTDPGAPGLPSQYNALFTKRGVPPGVPVLGVS